MNESMTSSVTNNRGIMYNCVTNTWMNRCYSCSMSHCSSQASSMCQSSCVSDHCMASINEVLGHGRDCHGEYGDAECDLHVALQCLHSPC